MKTTIAILLAAFAATAAAEPVTVGVHLGSVHIPKKPYHNNVNPGVYVRYADWTVGTYKNTISRQTVYLGYSKELGGGFEAMAGGATGYQRKCEPVCYGFSRGAVAPIIGLTYSPKTSGIRPRFWFTPGLMGASSVLHLSVEF